MAEGGNITNLAPSRHNFGIREETYPGNPGLSCVTIGDRSLDGKGDPLTPLTPEARKIVGKAIRHEQYGRSVTNSEAADQYREKLAEEHGYDSVEELQASRHRFATDTWSRYRQGKEEIGPQRRRALAAWFGPPVTEHAIAFGLLCVADNGTVKVKEQ